MCELDWRINKWTPRQVFCVEKAAREAGFKVYEDELHQVLKIVTEEMETLEFYTNIHKLINPATANTLP